MFTNFKRVIKFAFSDFTRNKGRSVAGIFVLVVTIGLVTSLFFLQAISGYIISQIENKIDITAYFQASAQESDILNVKQQLLALSPEVKSVQYVSADDALNNFSQKYSNNQVFSDALTQVGGNPFLPSLNISTDGDPAEYQKIASLLQSSQFSNLIESVDFSQKQTTIDEVFSITSNINKFGIALETVLVLIAISVVFNTIKLAIDSAKEEINTMRTVGASSWFVRAPFVIQGMLVGCIAFVICFLITAAAAFFLASGLMIFLSGFDVWNYFLSNVWLIILLQLGFGVGVGVLASVIVVQKYLKV